MQRRASSEAVRERLLEEQGVALTQGSDRTLQLCQVCFSAGFNEELSGRAENMVRARHRHAFRASPADDPVLDLILRLRCASLSTRVSP